MKCWIRSLKLAESARGTAPEPRPLLSQHPQTTPESLPAWKTLEQRAHITGYLVISGAEAHLEQVCVCQSGSCLYSSQLSPSRGSTQGRWGPQKQPPLHPQGAHPCTRMESKGAGLAAARSIPPHSSGLGQRADCLHQPGPDPAFPTKREMAKG